MFINDRQITISVGASRKATHWQPQTLSISELYERLKTPSRSTETLETYLKLSKPQQDDLKDVGGYVAGALSGPRRKGSAVAGRDIITLDFDSIPAGGTDAILRALSGLGCGYCVYSTRKHHAAAPRLRILFPLDRTATADEYEPCARRMATYIGIQYADPTTFEASRLMYWPSCSTDSEYIYVYADSPLLSVDGLLATYADWHDMGEWPQVPGAAVSVPRLAAKQGDPTTKPGIVGAFCRTYDIFAAMDKFLPGIYDPTDTPNRYTFTGGSTTGGAIVYDDGKFLFSHHATDPCGGKLVNAFDLVRLHKFDDKDDEAEAGTPINRLPSYAAMCEFALADADVAALLNKERYQEATKDFTVAPTLNVAEEAPENWMTDLERNGNGGFAKTLKNYKIIINNDPNFKGKIKLNLFSGRIDVVGTLPWSRATNSPIWTDTDTTELRTYMEPIIGKATKSDVADAIDACAGEHPYHPIRDYLEALSWDSDPRLDTLFIDYLGAVDTPYIRAVTRKAFTAAVARVMRPGVKYDTMTIIIGAQGRYKSTLLAKMGGAWFSDSLRNFGTKDSMETIQGTWINEIAEMQAMNNSEIDAVKAFLSKLSDYYRASYAHFPAERARQCVFFGTTNTHDCLRDTTGGRRFLPVDIDQQPRKKDVFRDLDAERDQLWAEAVTRWRMGEVLHLSKNLEVEAGIIQEDHRERHPWEGLILDFLGQQIPREWSKWDLTQRLIFRSGGIHGECELMPRTRVCAAEIWCECLGKNKGDFQQRNTREINQLLERVSGWANVGIRDAGLPYGKQRCFELKEATESICCCAKSP